MIINLSYLGDIKATNISKSFAHKMAAKTGWHRCGTKLRHCRPMYSQIKGRLLRHLFSESTHTNKQARTGPIAVTGQLKRSLKPAARKMGSLTTKKERARGQSRCWTISGRRTRSLSIRRAASAEPH